MKNLFYIQALVVGLFISSGRLALAQNTADSADERHDLQADCFWRSQPSEGARACLAYIRRFKGDSDIEKPYRRLEEYRETTGLTLQDLGTNPDELEQALQVGYASEACSIWKYLNNYQNNNSRLLLTKLESFGEYNRSSLALNVKANRYARCAHPQDDWTQLKKKLRAELKKKKNLELAEEACIPLAAAKKAQSEAGRNIAFSSYVEQIDELRKKDLLDFLPPECKLTQETALLVERAPYYNNLQFVLKDLNQAHLRLQKAQEDFADQLSKASEAVQKYNEHEEKPEVKNLKSLTQQASRSSKSE